MNQHVLKRIASKLNDGALNYSVFFQKYVVPVAHPVNSSTLVREALGTNAVIGGIDVVPDESVWLEIEEALLYPGNEGSGPSLSTLESKKLAELLSELKSEISDLVQQSQKIERFWLQDGHPSYPVFWDFAFLFVQDAEATILIGASSD